MGFAAAGLLILSFWLLALNQALVAILHAPEETMSRIYLIRLIAFLIIIVPIVIKNMGREGRR